MLSFLKDFFHFIFCCVMLVISHILDYIKMKIERYNRPLLKLWEFKMGKPSYFEIFLEIKSVSPKQ